MCVLQMNDVMLYTYPQQDGKYRLKNTLTLSGMKVRKQHFSEDQFHFLFIQLRNKMVDSIG